MDTAAVETPNDEPDDGDERRLLAQLRAGDDESFRQVVRSHGPRLLAVARRFLQNDEDAQDAVQDAFLSAFKAIDSFQGNSRLSTWLHRITINAALMKLRSRKREPERSIDNLLPKFADDGHLESAVEQWAVSYDTAIHDREMRELVRRKIDQLPESYRTVLLLRDIEGKSTTETAELLGSTVGAVKTRLHRARQALRTLLDPLMKGNGV